MNEKLSTGGKVKPSIHGPVHHVILGVGGGGKVLPSPASGAKLAELERLKRNHLSIDEVDPIDLARL